MTRANLFSLSLCLSLCFMTGLVRGQEPTTLTNGEPESGVQAEHPSPAPSGSQVVFSADFAGSSGLWIAGTDGGNLRQLTYNPQGDQEPVWSPDGKTIAFTSAHQGVTDIWSISPDGSNLRQLTSQVLNNREASWSADGSKIVFVSDRGGSNDIWIMNSDGSSPVRVTQLSGQENNPVFSPNGQKIVFSETASGMASLMTVNVDGSNLKALTNPLAMAEDWNPQWTATGIYFSSNRGDTTNHHMIWVVQPDGTGLHQYAAVAALDPVFLSDGRILFSEEFGDGPGVAQITLLQVSSGVKQPVTSVADYFVPADVNMDTSIDCLDLAAVKANFGKKVGQAGFNPRADANHDGVVDVRDLAFVSQHLATGTVCH